MRDAAMIVNFLSTGKWGWIVCNQDLNPKLTPAPMYVPFQLVLFEIFDIETPTFPPVAESLSMILAFSQGSQPPHKALTRLPEFGQYFWFFLLTRNLAKVR